VEARQVEWQLFEIPQSYCIQCKYIQCKQHSENVPRTPISHAVASKQHYGCSQAMVMANHYFTAGGARIGAVNLKRIRPILGVKCFSFHPRPYSVKLKRNQP
jgi:hypothetical protein